MLSTLRNMTKRLVLTFFVVTLLSTTSVYASSIYFLGYDDAGNTLWVSCGSSAGNYLAACGGNGPCSIASGGLADFAADMLCAFIS